MAGSLDCTRPPAGWKCLRRAGHRGICTVYPLTRTAKVFVPSEALMRLSLASERAHLARRHHGDWEACGVETCTRDRVYLGAHGIVGKNGRTLR